MFNSSQSSLFFDPRPTVNQRVFHRFSKVRSLVIQALSNIFRSTNQPQIRYLVANSGEQRWFVYDPVSNTRQLFTTEADAWQWLETQYYNS